MAPKQIENNDFEFRDTGEDSEDEDDQRSHQLMLERLTRAETRAVAAEAELAAFKAELAAYKAELAAELAKERENLRLANEKKNALQVKNCLFTIYFILSIKFVSNK